MRIIVLLLIAVGCFAQGNQNLAQTGVVDGHAAAWRFPETTFSALPSPAAGNLGWRYTVTDCLTSACTAGGGTVQADVRSDGSANWVVISGGSGGTSQASVWSGGSKTQKSVECTNGTTSYTALTAAAASQEITIQTGVSGSVWIDHITLSETTQFAGTTGLTVSMGRTSTNNAELTGGTFNLMVSNGDQNAISTRPIPTQLTSTYNIVLNFAVTAGNVNAANAGSLSWRLCGYADH